MTDQPPRSWKYRRRSIFTTLSGCFIGLAYIAVFGDDNALHREMADGLRWLAGLCIAVYVGGATTDDWLRDREAKR